MRFCFCSPCSSKSCSSAWDWTARHVFGCLQSRPAGRFKPNLACFDLLLGFALRVQLIAKPKHFGFNLGNTRANTNNASANSFSQHPNRKLQRIDTLPITQPSHGHPDNLPSQIRRHEGQAMVPAHVNPRRDPPHRTRIRPDSCFVHAPPAIAVSCAAHAEVPRLPPTERCESAFHATKSAERGGSEDEDAHIVVSIDVQVEQLIIHLIFLVPVLQKQQRILTYLSYKFQIC